ncbi:hypothetical protein KA005_18290, partial [bacterium]|nr:hypothetical protein [bacterium]
MKKYVLIFGLLMIIFPCQSWSATYYVAQSSVGSGNGSSYANRMSVSSHNSSSFSAGDTIYLCGTITSAIYPPSSGANGNPIIYDGDCPSGTPVEVINTTIGGSIDFTTKDYLTFQDIEGHGGDTGLKTAGGSTGITIKRCKLYNYDCRGIFITTSSGNPYGDNYDLTIGGADGDGNEIYDCGTNTAGADISLQRVHDFIISYNK